MVLLAGVCRARGGCFAFVEVGDCPADRAGLAAIDFTATETGGPLATIDVDAPVVRGDCSYERITAFEIPIALGPQLLGMLGEVGSGSCDGTSDLVGVIAHGFGQAWMRALRVARP